MKSLSIFLALFFCFWIALSEDAGVCVCESLSCVRHFATPWTVAFQVPLSMEFSRQEYWSGLPFPSPGDLLGPGIKPRSPVSPALQADSLPPALTGSPWAKVLGQAKKELSSDPKNTLNGAGDRLDLSCIIWKQIRSYLFALELDSSTPHPRPRCLSGLVWVGSYRKVSGDQEGC